VAETPVIAALDLPLNLSRRAPASRSAESAAGGWQSAGTILVGLVMGNDAVSD